MARIAMRSYLNGQLFLKELNKFKVTIATMYHLCLYLLSALDLIVFKRFSDLKYVPQYFLQIYFRLCNKIKSSCPTEWTLVLERTKALSAKGISAPWKNEDI